MAIGDSALHNYKSALGLGKETTWGTSVTETAFLEFDSESLMLSRDEIIHQQINSQREVHKRQLGNESVAGSLEFPLILGADAVVNILKQALGGTVASSVISSTNSAYTHVINTGDMESNAATTTATDMKGLTLKVRRGPSHVWVYNGCRVNTLTIKGAVGEEVKVTAEIVGKSGTTDTALSSTVAYSDVLPVIFRGVTIKNASGIGSITAGSGTAETFQSFELQIQNNLQSDLRQLGSRNIGVLPVGGQNVTLNLEQRFDTFTAYTRFDSETALAFGIYLDSLQTIGAEATTYSMRIDVPRAYHNSTQPQVSGRDGILQQTLNLTCLRENTTGSYAVRFTIHNGTANYQ